MHNDSRPGAWTQTIWQKRRNERVIGDNQAPAKTLLRDEHLLFGTGWLSRGNVLFTLTFRAGDVRSGNRSWQHFRGDWSEWPIIESR